MKEKTISITRNDDPTIVKDESGEILKKVKKAYNDMILNYLFTIGFV